MAFFDLVAVDLFRLYGSGGEGLTEQEVIRWSAVTGLDRSTLYDRIALFLARGFHSGELRFEFCDQIVNDIHGVITLADECRPELFWEAYLAFDDGEYYHSNNPDADPIEFYTKPQIARIVADTARPTGSSIRKESWADSGHQRHGGALARPSFVDR